MKNILSTAVTSVSKVTGRTGLKIQKHSPELCLIGGVVSFIGTVVLASRSTLKAAEVIEKHNAMMDEIHEAEEIDIEYAETMASKEKAVVCLKTAGNFAKLYAPSASLGALSLTFFFGAYHITKMRYLGAVAAFNAVTEAFGAYRGRVIDELGVESDRKFMYGAETKEVTETILDENGKKVKSKSKVEEIDKNNINEEIDRVFDKRNPNWEENHNINMMFLTAQQNILNDFLHSRGHVFLNEVYEALGFPHTSIGAVVGWLDKREGSDGFIDFGLQTDENKIKRYVNGVDNEIVLTFNHDGVIFEKI